MPILGKIYSNCIKKRQKKNHLINLCHNPTNTLTTYIMILTTFILLFKGVISFILVFKIVQ